MDRAAAELLRPMLRQWLADNMPRIVEDALRSELTEQTQVDGKGPGKA
jgi:cell pole-organizing protein PopZ